MKAISNACKILRLFRVKPYWSIREISEIMNLHRSTVHRTLDTMCAAGFVEFDHQVGHYKLGLAMVELGLLSLERMDLRNEALPLMRELQRQTMETIDLSIFVEGEVLFIEHLESPEGVVVASSLGRRLPAYCVAPGKIFLAYLDEAELDQYLERTELVQFTKYTITDPAWLKEHLYEVRKNGIAFDLQEHWEEVAACGVPIYNYQGKVIAALSVAGLASKIMQKLNGDLPELARQAAAAISERMGYFRTDLSERSAGS